MAVQQTHLTTSQVTYAMQVNDTYNSTLYTQYGGNRSHLIAQEIKYKYMNIIDVTSGIKSIRYCKCKIYGSW